MASKHSETTLQNNRRARNLLIFFEQSFYITYSNKDAYLSVKNMTTEVVLSKSQSK